jgi:steroid 5-alpha reductase family enzyme
LGYSRRPNYFGEMLVWGGLFIFAVPFLEGAAFAVVIGPVFITLLSTLRERIPPLEQSAEAKYGDDAAYSEYKATDEHSRAAAASQLARGSSRATLAR